MANEDTAEPLPKLLCATAPLVAAPAAPTGILWKLSEPERQLDANLVHLPAAAHIDVHCEPDLDVLLFVVRGTATLGAGTSLQPESLNTGDLLWLPHGSTRDLTAGPDGVSYLTTHRRRPGMQIRSPR